MITSKRLTEIRECRKSAEEFYWNHSTDAHGLSSHVNTLGIAIDDLINAYERLLYSIAGEFACKTCGGLGRRVYGSTATFWGGVGGQAMTSNLCDKCWGSGTTEWTGPDLRRMNGYIRKLENDLEDKVESVKRIAREAAEIQQDLGQAFNRERELVKAAQAVCKAIDSCGQVHRSKHKTMYPHEWKEVKELKTILRKHEEAQADG